MKRLETMIERLDWVLANRGTVTVEKNGKPVEVPMNAGNWCLAAGVSRKALYTQMDRMRSEPYRTLTASTVEKLAPAASVSVGWLASGEGDPNDGGSVAVERRERYVAMPIVRRMALEEGFDPEFVRTFEALLDADEQPKPSELWNLMQAAYARHQRKVVPRGDPLADLDEPAARQTARKKR